MTDFVVSITDAASLAGITWAREQRNASLPPGDPPSEPGGEPGPSPVPPLETDAEYVQWVMEQASASYASDQHNAQWREMAAADAAKRSAG